MDDMVAANSPASSSPTVPTGMAFCAKTKNTASPAFLPNSGKAAAASGYKMAAAHGGMKKTMLPTPIKMAANIAARLAFLVSLAVRKR